MRVFVDFSYTKTFLVQGEGDFKSKKDAEKQIRDDPSEVECCLCPAQSSNQTLETEIYEVRKA